MSGCPPHGVHLFSYCLGFPSSHYTEGLRSKHETLHKTALLKSIQANNSSLKRVVQEAGLAREAWLVWGKAEIEIWQVPALAAWFAYSIDAPRLTDGMRVGDIWRQVFADIMCTYQNQPTWRDKVPLQGLGLGSDERVFYVDLLFCARSLRSTDERDIIYSSLGSPLAYYDDGRVMVAPDYDEPSELLQVRAAKALLLNDHEAPHLLLRVVHEASEDLGDNAIPSWIPRWTTSLDAIARPMPLSLTYEYRHSRYHATFGSAPFQVSSLRDNILTIMGFKFDTIAWVSPPLKSGDLESDVSKWDPSYRDNKISAIESIWRQLLAHSSRPSEEIIYSFSQTLARGRPGSQHYHNSFLAYCQFLRTNAQTDGTSPFPPPEPNKGNSLDAERTVRRSRARRLACTSIGRLALLPVISHVRDICCLVQGLDIPVILRETPRGTYKFVGDSYIHGVMEGELMGSPGPEWGSLRLE